MRRSRRVDWDEEALKTERARRKGLLSSLVALLMVLIFLLVSKRVNPGLEVWGPLKVVVALIGAAALAYLISRRRERRADGRKG